MNSQRLIASRRAGSGENVSVSGVDQNARVNIAATASISSSRRRRTVNASDIVHSPGRESYASKYSYSSKYVDSAHPLDPLEAAPARRDQSDGRAMPRRQRFVADVGGEEHRPQL